MQRCTLPTLDTAAPGALDASMHTFFGDPWPEHRSAGGWSYRQVPQRRRRKGAPRPAEAQIDPTCPPPPESPFWTLPAASAAPGPEVLDTAVDALARLSI